MFRNDTSDNKTKKRRKYIFILLYICVDESVYTYSSSCT